MKRRRAATLGRARENDPPPRLIRSLWSPPRLAPSGGTGTVNLDRRFHPLAGLGTAAEPANRPRRPPHIAVTLKQPLRGTVAVRAQRLQPTSTKPHPRSSHWLDMIRHHGNRSYPVNRFRTKAAPSADGHAGRDGSHRHTRGGHPAVSGVRASTMITSVARAAWWQRHPGAARQLGELLRAVAVFAVGGAPALAARPHRTGNRRRANSQRSGERLARPRDHCLPGT